MNQSFFEFADYFKRQRIVDQKAGEYLGETGCGNKYSMGNLVMHSGDSFNGAFVKNQMKQKGIKAQFLADLLDVNVGTVRNWLNGKSRPYAWYAFAVVVYLDLDESEVIIREKS